MIDSANELERVQLRSLVVIRCFAIALIVLSAHAFAEEKQPVTIVTYDVLPPFAFRDDSGELTGIYIEIVRTAVNRMPDYKLAFDVVPWARAKKLAEKGKAFAILPPYFHAHDWLTTDDPKRPYLWPYSLPLFLQKDVVICSTRGSTPSKGVYPDYLEGVTVAMWRGDGRAGELFAKRVDEGKINVAYANSIKDVARLLLYGLADCTVSAKLPFSWYVNEIKRSAEYAAKSKNVTLEQIEVVSSNEGYLAYTDVNAETNYPYKKDFSQKFDIEIYRMKKSGEIDSIVNRFLTSP